MATDTTKLSKILNALELFDNGVFSHLTTTNKLHIAITLLEADPDLADVNALLTTFYAGYKVYEAMGFTDVSFYDKLMLTAQTMRMTVKGEITAPVAETFRIDASTELTVVDLAADDTVQIGAVLLTAVAADATPKAYEFAIGEDAAGTTTNILAALDYIGGSAITLFLYNAVEGATDKIYFQSKLPGTAGNAIDTVVTTEGTSAFSAVKMVGGVDANKGSAAWDGRTAVDIRGNAKEYLGNAWLDKFNKFTVNYIDTDLEELEPAVNAQAMLNIVNDIAALDTIVIGTTTLTCIASGEPAAGEFVKGADATTTAANIMAALTAIVQEEFTFEDVSAGEYTRIVFIAAIAGLGGNTLDSSVTTSGTTAFASSKFTGGLDVRYGNPIIDEIGAMTVKPDILNVKYTTSGDYSVTPLVVNVPDDYMFVELQLFNSNPSDTLKNITVKDRTGVSMIDCTVDIYADSVKAINRKENIASNPGDTYLYITTDTTTANLQLCFKFKKFVAY